MRSQRASARKGRTRRAMPVRGAAGGGGAPGLAAWVDTGIVSDRGGTNVIQVYSPHFKDASNGLALGYDRSYVTTDGGDSWTMRTEAGLDASLTYSPSLDRYVCWKYNTGLWYSDDGGVTWTQSNETSGIPGPVKWVPFLNEFMMARYNNQARFSADGITWGAAVASTFIRNVTRAYVGPNEVIFSGSLPDFNRRMVGKTAGDFSTMSGINFEFHAVWCGSFGWRANPNLSSNQLLYSSTNGASWTNMGNVLPSNQVWDGIAFDPDLERLWIVGADETVHYSDDGGSTWTAAPVTGVGPDFTNGPHKEWNNLYFVNGALYCGGDKLVHSP